MKKTFFYLFAIFCCFAMCLVSCEKPQVENDDDDVMVVPEGAIGLQALNSEYSTGAEMGYSSAVSHSFLLMFATEECEVTMGSAFGSGKLVVLELCSATAENMLPGAGIYQIGDAIEDGSIVAGFDFDSTPIGSYTYTMVNDELLYADCIVDGAVEIKKTKKDDVLEFFIYAIFEDGTEANYYYKGKLLIEHVGAE
ncbi:MAG: hypothetical protein IKV26_02660 [Paludibacteraceae bacterium]|nr:hypothetical protein [Paludibacteraceae bacterium]